MEKEIQKDLPSKKTDAFRINSIASTEDGKVPLCTTINKPLEFVSAIINDISNFPQFFAGLERVEMEGLRSSWFYRSANADELSSIAMKLNEDRSNRTMTWQTDDSMGFDYSVSIKLDKAQADRGTIVQMRVTYDSRIAELFSVFEKMAKKDADTVGKINLQRLKAFCETGSTPTIEGQPSGRDEESKKLKH